MIEKNMLGAGLVGPIAARLQGQQEERSLDNRVGHAVETVNNTAKSELQAAGVLGGTALAYDTFAAEKKTIVPFLKGKLSQIAERFNKFKEGLVLKKDSNVAKDATEIIENLKKQGAKVIEDVKTGELPKNIKKQIADSDISKKIIEGSKKLKGTYAENVDKVTELVKGSKIKKAFSSAIQFLKENKKLAIIAAGATALLAVITNSAHRQGKIDQKYEDKAKLEEYRRRHNPEI